MSKTFIEQLVSERSVRLILAWSLFAIEGLCTHRDPTFGGGWSYQCMSGRCFVAFSVIEMQFTDNIRED
jgi:hypothetical protein